MGKGYMVMIKWETYRHRRPERERGAAPVGSMIFTGHQGQGKTISLVRYALEYSKLFPTSVIITNVKILFGKDFDYTSRYFYYSSPAQLVNLLSSITTYPRLVIIDECHLYFSRTSGIPLSILSTISQQRKRRTKILMTSQIWEELDISLRKQVKEWVECSKHFYGIKNVVKDGETLEYDKLQGKYVAQKLYSITFNPNKIICNAYDTYQEVVSNADSQTLPIQGATNINIIAKSSTTRRRR